MSEAVIPLSFGDFPDDVQLCVLSFLHRFGDTPAAAAAAPSPPLVFFEWGAVLHHRFQGYSVEEHGLRSDKKALSVDEHCPRREMVNYLDPEGREEVNAEDLVMAELGVLESELIQVNVSFIGKCQVVVEENLEVNLDPSSPNLRGEVSDDVYGSPPDQMKELTYEMLK